MKGSKNSTTTTTTANRKRTLGEAKDAMEDAGISFTNAIENLEEAHEILKEYFEGNPKGYECTPTRHLYCDMINSLEILKKLKNNEFNEASAGVAKICEDCESFDKKPCVNCADADRCVDCCPFGGEKCKSCGGHLEGNGKDNGLCCDCGGDD